MIDYQLGVNEVLLVEVDCHAETSSNKAKCNTVALTNQNIYMVYLSFFGKVKEIKKYPITDVNTFNGDAAIIYNEKLFEEETIDITVKYDRIKMTVAWEDRKDAKAFVNKLNEIVSGSTKNIANGPIPGVEELASSIASTIGVLKGAFGLKRNNVKKCGSCGATISGETGKIVTCSYCGNKNKL